MSYGRGKVLTLDMFDAAAHEGVHDIACAFTPCRLAAPIELETCSFGWIRAVPKWPLGILLLSAMTNTGYAQDTESIGETLRRTLETSYHRLLIKKIENGGELAPFSTDGCSGGITSGWAVAAELIPGFEDRYREKPPWENCCLDHDQVYHFAGNAATADESYYGRLAADEALLACVLAQGEQDAQAIGDSFNVSREIVEDTYAVIGQAMFNAVRLGGGPCSGLPWRWGYGYPSCLWP